MSSVALSFWELRTENVDLTAESPGMGCVAFLNGKSHFTRKLSIKPTIFSGGMNAKDVNRCQTLIVLICQRRDGRIAEQRFIMWDTI